MKQWQFGCRIASLLCLMTACHATEQSPVDATHLAPFYQQQKDDTAAHQTQVLQTRQRQANSDSVPSDTQARLDYLAERYRRAEQNKPVPFRLEPILRPGDIVTYAVPPFPNSGSLDEWYWKTYRKPRPEIVYVRHPNGNVNRVVVGNCSSLSNPEAAIRQCEEADQRRVDHLNQQQMIRYQSSLDTIQNQINRVRR